MFYKLTTVYSALQTKIGFKNPSDSANYSVLDSALLVSDSGEYYNNAHALLTPEIIQENAPNFSDFASATIETDLSAWYTNLEKESIIQAVNAVFDARKDKVSTKDIKVSDSLTIDTNDLTTADLIETTGDYIGVLITPVNSRNAKVTINKIGLKVEGLASPLTISLYYKTTSGDAITATEFIIDNGFNWVTIDKEIFLADGRNGNEIFCYLKQSELTELPFRIEFVSKDTRYLLTKPQITDTSFEQTDISYYAFDLDVSVACDFTKIIVNNSDAFINVIKLSVGVKLLEVFINSMRDNRTNERAKEMAKYDLDGENNPNSLRNQYFKAVDNCHLDFSNLDKLCLPCSRKRKIKYGVV